MKFGVVNKSTILNKFVFHTLQRNITHLAVKKSLSKQKTRYFERGELEKNRQNLGPFPETITDGSECLFLFSLLRGRIMMMLLSIRSKKCAYLKESKFIVHIAKICP